ncbi:C40 family peptidase [Nanchangia anserum]|uniref:NlpC/P60 family protein n=1 Tax=Nanchangia anserum TaxID=2692125 RepID=UPI0018832ABE|nr:NlpC/P60 family protein [Nanchangia anserum]QOX82048.1 C40 family peptidase [Nanchangia anserum]
MYYSLNKMGIKAPRLTAAGFQSASKPIAWGSKVPGDLLFWGDPAYHVAIYAGGSKLVEEPGFHKVAIEWAIWGSPTVGRYKFDEGGLLPPGIHTVANFTGKPEPVFTSGQFEAMRSGPTEVNLHIHAAGPVDEAILADRVSRRLLEELRA